MGGLAPVDARASQASLRIDLAALRANWRLLATRIAPESCAAVVKADAYGTGTEQAVLALSAEGCRSFFVAHPSEAIRVRAQIGQGSDIYVLNGFPAGDLGALYKMHDLRPVLGSAQDVTRWLAVAGERPRAALHLDTGMNRLGCDPADLYQLAPDAAAGAALAERLGLSLVMSHLVSSEVPSDPLNRLQIETFSRMRLLFAEVPASLANSSGLFLPGRPAFDLGRPGYALYGGNPTPGATNPMRPVVHLTAPILQIREIEAGATVGYNAQWTARRRTRLATIGVGYADGLPRNLMATDARSGGAALVAGILCSFAGRVSMDLTIIDITDVPASALAPGLQAELLGETIGVDEMGTRAGTIGYEILTNLGRRYHRIYEGG